MCCSSDKTVGILDGLCFVENKHVPVFPTEFRPVQTQKPVACDHHIGLFLELPLWPIIKRGLEPRAKFLNLRDPVENDACRCHDQCFPANRANGLEGFSKPHVVCEQSAHFRVSKKGKPVDPLSL